MAESPTASRIRERIDEIYARGVVVGDDGNSHEIGLTSVNRHRGNFIADLVGSERPRATLEVGMAWGLSTLFILKALLENGDEFRPHVVVDPFQTATFHRAALRTVRELGLAERVEFHEQRSDVILPRLVSQKRQFDLAFIDGDHSFAAVFADLRLIHMLLRPGGLVIFDDADWDGIHMTCRIAEANFAYCDAPATEPWPVESDRDGPGRQGRQRIRAYRKPLRDGYLAQNPVVPSFPEMLGQIPSRQLRHEGHLALRVGDVMLARLYFKVALRGDPLHFKTYLRLARSYLPRRLVHAFSKPSRLATTAA